MGSATNVITPSRPDVALTRWPLLNLAMVPPYQIGLPLKPPVEQLSAKDGLHGKIEVEHTPEEIADAQAFGVHYVEYLIPAEVANQYGPPTDVTDDEDEKLPTRPPRLTPTNFSDYKRRLNPRPLFYVRGRLP